MNCINKSEKRTHAVGCDNPDIYIITGNPKAEDIEAGYPMSGSDGKYMTRMLSLCDCYGNTRIINLCNCDIDDEEEFDYTNCMLCNLLEDLYSCKPKVVVTVGKNITKFILGKQFTKLRSVLGRVFNCTIGNRPYKVVPSYSPTYVLNEISKLEESEDDEDGGYYTTVPLDFAKQMHVVSLVALDKDLDVLSKKDIKNFFTADEYIEEFNKYYRGKQFAYDIETTAKMQFTPDLRIVGFSNALKDRGFYLCMESLDFKMSDEELKKVKDFLRDTLKEHNVIVHNSMYERPVTLKELDYELTYEQLDDTMVQARLMLGGALGAGLKVQAQTHLGYPDWDSDCGVYLSNAKNLLNTIVSRNIRIGLKYKTALDDQPVLTKSGKVSKKKNKTWFATLEEFVESNLTLKWCQALKDNLEEIKIVCYKYYDLEETANLVKLLEEKAMYHLMNDIPVPSGAGKVLPYSYIPSRVISKYGAVDSIATFDLYEYYNKIMEKESNDIVNLSEGYKIWLQHIFTGYIFERNGVYWDDDLAEKDRIFYSKLATDTIKKMIMTPKIKKYIVENSKAKYLPIVLSDYYPNIALTQGFQVVYDHETEGYKVSKDGKHVAMKMIDEIKLPTDSSGCSKVDDCIYMLLCEDVKEAESYLDLKGIYNPSSTKQNNIPIMMLSNDEIKLANKIYELDNYYKSTNYNVSLRPYIQNKMTKEELDFIFRCTTSYESLVALKNDREVTWRKKSYETAKIINYLSGSMPKITNKLLYEVIQNKFKILSKVKLDESKIEIKPLRDEKIITFEKLGEISIITHTLLCNEIDDYYLTLANNICDEKFLKKSGKDWYLERRKLFELFRSLESMKVPSSPYLREIMATEYEMTSMSEDKVLLLHELYLITGIDAENINSWTEEFNWLRDYRIFKKVTKVINTYINGIIGRKNVMIVDSDELSEGHDVTMRKRLYEEGKADLGESYLLASSFKVCTAQTGRWKTGLHTLPWGSPVKKYYTSRFKGGTIFCPDYSQAEVRALAASAKCESMLQAFRDGLDIHKVTASGIFNKPLNKVTDAERRFSKGAVFSILYGSARQSFADEYCEGDLDRANEIFDGFFASYPEVEDWIEARHQEYLDTGRVSTLTNRYIVIAPDGSGSYIGSKTGALRKAQNYPIQGCLKSDTKVKSIDGKSYEIGDLVKNDVKELWVYSRDPKTNKIVPAKAINPHITKYVDQITKVTLDDGSVIECTDNHKFRLKDGTYCEAKDLQGKSISSLYTKMSGNQVVSVETCSVKEPLAVYDLSVPGYENFAIETSNNNGIFVHNSSSDIVGSVSFEVCNFITKNKYKSKPFLFVHDSIEIDTHPKEFLEFCVVLKKLLNDVPIEKFGTPSKAEVTLGCSLGHEIELEDLEVNEDYTEATLYLAGYAQDIYDTVENWKQAYTIVEIVEEYCFKINDDGTAVRDEDGNKIKIQGYADEYVSYKELFMKKRAYNHECGNTVKRGCAIVHIKY